MLAEGFTVALERAREHVARACGAPFVVTIEAMGYRVVPARLVDSFGRLLEKSDAKVTGIEPRGGG